MGKNSNFGHKVALTPALAKLDIVEAYRKAKCDKQEAAEILGISYQSLHRYVTLLGVGEALDRLKARAKKEGWHHEKNVTTKSPEVRAKLRKAWTKKRRAEFGQKVRERAEAAR